MADDLYVGSGMSEIRLRCSHIGDLSNLSLAVEPVLEICGEVTRLALARSSIPGASALLPDRPE